MSLEQFLINMDMSLAKSEAFGNFIDRLEDDSNQELPLTMHEWREVISHALHSQYLLLLEYPIQNNIRQVIHHEIVIRIKQTEQGEWITARKFIPFAERLKLISKLDIFVLQTIIARLHHESTLKRYAINVSVQTLLSPEFDDLLADLSSESRSVLNRIAIELPEYGVNKHADKIKIKLREIRLLGMQIGVDHFSVKSAKMLQILDNEIDFIKIDALFIRQLDVNSLNKQFLLSVINIAHQLDIDVIAKGVDDESQVPLLFELGFDGVTGAVIDA
jgi:EAL domain-containing protein (putative c-di-GMP-specific phosphodiesterase class I)